MFSPFCDFSPNLLPFLKSLLPFFFLLTKNYILSVFPLKFHTHPWWLHLLPQGQIGKKIGDSWQHSTWMMACFEKSDFLFLFFFLMVLEVRYVVSNNQIWNFLELFVQFSNVWVFGVFWSWFLHVLCFYTPICNGFVLLLF